MTAFTIRRPSRRPLVVVIGILAIAIGTQVATVWNGDQAGLDEPLLAAPPPAEIDTDAGPIGAAGANAVAVPAPTSAVPLAGVNAAAVPPAPAVPTHGPALPPRPTSPQGLRSHGRAHPDPRRRRLWAARLIHPTTSCPP